MTAPPSPWMPSILCSFSILPEVPEKPKGVLHTTGGYMVGATLSSKLVFDLKDEDTYWCTADVGWITGHSYIVYGPLANGATSVMFEGAPNWPDEGRFWKIIEKYKVNILYNSPHRHPCVHEMGRGMAPQVRSDLAAAAGHCR